MAFDVRARLVLDTGQYYRGLLGATGQTKQLEDTVGRIGPKGRRAGREAGRGIKRIGDQAALTKGILNGLVGRMVALGATYIGIHALTSSVGRLGRGMISFSSDLEQAEIGIAGIIGAVDKLSFAQAESEAKKALDTLRQLSIQSPATTFEMLDIFKGIVGPMRAAGTEMSKILDLTQKTTLTAAKMGVDFPQAARDINMMIRGAAGMDVKLFSLLRSTGAITESTEAWNKSLPPAERIQKLDEALSKFATPEAAAAFENSWKGITSTLTDISQMAGAAFMAPVMAQAKKSLGGLRDTLLEHRDELNELAALYGGRVARGLAVVSDHLVSGFQYVRAHWDEITDRFNQGVKLLRSALPVMAAIAAAFQVFQTGAGLAGMMGIGAGGGAVTGGGRGKRGGLGMSKATRALAAQQAADPWRKVNFMGAAAGGGLGLRGLLAGLGGGGAAAGAGAGGTAAAGGGAAAALTSAAAALGIVAAAAAVVAGSVMTVKDNWMAFSNMFTTATGDLGAQASDLWKSFKGALAPSLKLVGNIVMGTLTPAMQIFAASLETAIVVLTDAFEILGNVVTFINEYLGPSFSALFSAFQSFGAHIDYLLEKLSISPTAIAKGGLGDVATGIGLGMDLLSETVAKGVAADINEALGTVPSARGGAVINQNNDFRGSRISIKQDFGDEHDPDRIVRVMQRDLTRQAEHRVSTSFSPAFTR